MDDRSDPAEHTTRADGPDPRRTRLEIDGRPLLDFQPFDVGRPQADHAVPLAPLEVVVPAIMSELAGWIVNADDDALTDALLAAGATMERHSRLMHRAIVPADRILPGEAAPDVVATPGGHRQVEPVARHVRAISELSLLAYPPGHPDAFTGDVDVAMADVEAYVDGSMLGPLIAEASAVALDEGRVVAVCIVNDMTGTPPAGGPWITDVFRLPGDRHRGAGAALLQRAIGVLAAQGATTLGLAVTVGNPAFEVYRRLGFTTVSAHRKVAIPVQGSLG